MNQNVCQALQRQYLMLFLCTRLSSVSLENVCCCPPAVEFVPCDKVPREIVEEFPPLHAEASLGRLGCLAPNMGLPTRTFVLLIKIYQNTLKRTLC